MKRYSVAVVGCGNRGNSFVGIMQEMPDKYEIVSLCDVNAKQIDKIHSRYGLENTKDFTDEKEFFEEKHADVIIIGTSDRFHVAQTVRAMDLGYEVLLEKPISDDRDEIKQLFDAYKRTGKTVTIFHELRYGNGYRKCKELLNSGAIGELYAIDASERAVYWHWAQAYVRGIGSLTKNGHPVILGKCSHDLDLIQWFADSKCDTVSSLGNRSYFKPENAPEDAADRCLECEHADTCPYSAKRIYIDAWHKEGEPEFVWPYNKVSFIYPNNEENIREGLCEKEYGLCAYKCDVDQVDNQFVQMNFENGVKASLKMVYGAKAGRRYAFYGTLGEIVFDEREDTVELMPFGEEKQVFDLGIGAGHGGGDPVLIAEFYDVLEGKRESATKLEESLEAHLMGISAEESRKNGGKLVKVHQ